jgi:hypothetical protein
MEEQSIEIGREEQSLATEQMTSSRLTGSLHPKSF